MKKCIQCGCEFDPLPVEENELDEGVLNNVEDDNICEECWQEEFRLENTCPVHHIFCPEGFCEACIEEKF